MVCSIGAAWAATYKNDFTNSQVVWLTTENVTAAVSSGWITSATTSTKKITPKIAPNTDGDYTDGEITVYQVKQETSRYLILHVTNVSSITIYSHNGGKDDRTLKAKVNKGSELSVASTKAGNSAYGKIKLDSETKNDIRLYATGDLAVYAIKLEVINPNAPVLVATPEKIAFSLNPYLNSASTSFMLTGKNLTNGTYDLTMPSVAGLSVTPQNFTVSEGVANQEFTVSYTSEVDVEKATANIVAVTATTDNVSVTIPVTYSANITGYEQTIVTEAKTWDWTSITEEVKLTADTKPSINDAIVLKNLEDRISFPATFDAQALVVKAEYPARNKRFQNGEIRFKTSVAGYITVDFADTGVKITEGSTPNERYLNVNGVNTEYYVVRTGSSDGRKTTGEIFVPAGEVVIKGRNADNTEDAAYCLYKLTFTPVFPQTITITDAKFATCVANSNLDFTSSDVTAYAITDVTATAVELTKVEKVKAGQAIVVGAEAAGNYDIPVATEDFEGTESLMKSSAEDVAVTEENSHYIVANGDNGVGFYPVKVGTAIPAGKGYLTVDATNAAKFLSFGLDATGISEVKTAATEGNGEIYNLNGQRVAAPSKGLYIMNGKKVIFK